ncbi:MAG: hypothetical protein U0L77_03410, partial [Prevotellamassilia sp.]|nr:hypothetical protein [Prevotellamassilia sp.]
AMDFYATHTKEFIELPTDRVIIGTDINSVIDIMDKNPNKKINSISDIFHKLHRLGNFNQTIKNIFNI